MTEIPSGPSDSDDRTYGPLINLIQDMWGEHDERAQGSCGCKACKAGVDLFDALCDIYEAQR